MLPRFRVLAAAILGPVLAVACLAQNLAQNEDASKPADASLSSPSTESSAPGFRPANPFFGRILVVDPAPQPQAARTSSSSDEDITPAVEVFGGYSYFRFNVKGLTKHENFGGNGGIGSIAGNVNRWFGIVGDVAYYKLHNTPNGVSAKMLTFMFGPKFSHRGERWTPFGQVLFGGARENAKFGIPGPTNSFFSPTNPAHQTKFAMAAGGGVDLKLTRRFAWRVFEAEYVLTKFNDGNNNQQNNLRAATGLVFRFGGGPPPPPPNRPPVVTLAANPNKVTVGDTSILQAKASDPDGDPLTYAWTSTCGTVEGTGAETHFNSTNANPGPCTVTVKVDDGRGGNASATTDVTVEARPNHPPTVTCAASPQTVEAGQPVTLTATGNDPDGDQLTYSWDATGGKVSGSGANAQLDTTGLAPGHYTVNCHADDGKGGKGDGSAGFDVQKPQEQARLETRLSLHSIYFPTAVPTVQNPQGGLLASQERTLVTLASDYKKYLTFSPNAHLILQGHADPRGGEEYNKALSDRRVERTKAFLVEQGVPADHIDTQGLGEEQPMTDDQVKQAIDQDQSVSPAEKKQLTAKAHILALAQSRRVDVTLSTTGQTSVRQYPFNAEDALNLINPRGPRTGKAAPAGKAPAKKGGTKKGATKKGSTT